MSGAPGPDGFASSPGANVSDLFAPFIVGVVHKLLCDV